MIIGINCIKGVVAIAETIGDRQTFQVEKLYPYQYSLQTAKDCTDLYKNLKTILSGIKNNSGHSKAVILSCSTGSRGSSIDSIKAEAIVELACDSLGISVSYVKPQSLKSTLQCAAKEKWQQKAKILFNPNGSHKNFNKGSDGAVAAAYKELDN